MSRRARIVFGRQRPPGTHLTFCVHRPAGESDRTARGSYTPLTAPPRPGPVGGKGYAILEIVDGPDVFRFTSGAEIDEFCRVMARKILPRAEDLRDRYGLSAARNTIWISRVPKRSFVRRQKLVAFIRKNETAFRRLVAPYEHHAAPLGAPGSHGTTDDDR